MSTDELLPTRDCDRTFRLDDLHVRADGGDGRTVEAYAAVFNTRTEIRDQDGHYNETLGGGSFTQTIKHRGTGFGVLFNHGRTIDGTPSALGTMPIGVPLEVRADERGVFTVTRYLDNPLADQVLDAIKQGAITAQSFSGRFRKSARSWPDGRGGPTALPLVTRQEVEMREYGPAVFAAYDGAAILGTRAETFVRALLAVPAEGRLEWLESFGIEGEAPDVAPLALRARPLRDKIAAARRARGDLTIR